MRIAQRVNRQCYLCTTQDASRVTSNEICIPSAHASALPVTPSCAAPQANFSKAATTVFEASSSPSWTPYGRLATMPSVEEYTIACICALSTEAVALRLFLDEEYEGPEILSSHVSTQDHNVYTTGSIGGHKVVVATLPFGRYGVSQATSVISDMVRSFPNLRCCFMVGISGGAPSLQHDIRLGDIVVSAPVHRSGGILQYDHGQAIQGQQFRITQHLNEPPRFLLSAVGKLAQDYEMEGHPLQDMVNDILAKKPRLKAKYQRPDSNSDRLYKPSAVHPIDAYGNCEELCGNEASKLVERPLRAAGLGAAEIHYGIIASGSSLVQDAGVRDRLSEQEGILCFEMEAAGLVNQFPCLVIRGICDYSDSHKNYDWQGYAAMMAAAYTREILRVLSPGKVSSADKVIDKFSTKLSGIEKGVQQLTTCCQDTQKGDERKKVLQWLPFTDYTDRQNKLQRERYEGTGQWFLDTEEFQTWVKKEKYILFCPGMPGVGKTHIASLVIYDLQTSNHFETIPGLAYIYFEYTQQQTREALLASLLEQLARPLHPLPVQLITLYEIHAERRTQPSVNELQRVLHDVASNYERSFIVVDGLDECADDEGMRNFFLDTLIKLRRTVRASILATSRDVQYIERYFNDQKKCLQIRIEAQDDDICQYLDYQIPRVLPLLVDNLSLCRKIKTVIMAAAGGMFLLAMLHVTSLKGKVNVKAIEDSLAELISGGSSLMAAYDKTMKMIECQEEGHRKLAKDTLSWVAFSNKPLRVEELQHALAIEIGKDDLNPKNITELDIIISTCAGLITIQKGSIYNTVHLIHETTRDYFDKTHERWFGKVGPRLARLSVNYLTFRSFESGPCKTYDDLLVRRRRYPFYEYLGRSFKDYIKGNDEDVRVKVMLKKFFLSDMHLLAHIQQTQPFLLRHGKELTALHLAISYRIRSLIPLLLHKGANVQDEHGRTPLHLAVLTRFYEGIQSLISAPEVNLNATASGKRTALSYACELGDEEAVRFLLACDKLDCNLADEHGVTPLSYALKKCHLTVVQILLGVRDVDCITPDHEGLVPLCYAALGGCEGCVQELLKKSEVDVNTIFDGKIAILHWAVKESKMSTFKHVLNKPGLNVNVRDAWGRTPLFWCIARHSYYMADLLLSREDVELSLVDDNGQGLLIWAVKWGRPYLRDIFLSKVGSQLLVKDNFHRSAFDYAAERGYWQIIIPLLKEHKTVFRMEHGFYGTALFYAIKRKNSAFTKLLLDRTDMNVGRWAINALALSMEDPELKCFTILRSKLKVWMESHPEWMFACLLRVAEKGADHILNGILKALRRNSAGTKMVQVDFLGDRSWDEIYVPRMVFEIPFEQVDVRDRLGQTALHSAASRGDVVAARILLMMGADKCAKNTAGYTPFECASNGPGSLKAVRMVLEPSRYEEPQVRDGG